MSEEFEERMRFYDKKVLILDDIVSLITCAGERDDTRLFALAICEMV